MTVKGGASQACAACKYQRRKCSAECVLAPFFPPDQPKMFQNAHRLFGVRNMLKILEPLNHTQKMEAMRSIICQANIRDRFPVHGCHGFIVQLQYQIQQTYLELEAVNAQLSICRQHHHITTTPSPDPPQHSPSQLQSATTLHNNALSLFQDHPHHHQQYNAFSLAPPCSLSPNNSSFYDTYACMDPKENLINHPLWGVDHSYYHNNTNNSMPIQYHQPVATAQAIQFPHNTDEVPQDYNEIPCFFDTIDDRQSYINSKEAYESSSDSSLKDTTQSIENFSDNELKSAAACFNLASVN